MVGSSFSSDPRKQKKGIALKLQATIGSSSKWSSNGSKNKNYNSQEGRQQEV